jgi:Fic family protein
MVGTNITNTLPHLPLAIDLETVPILRQASRAHKALGELKGVTDLIPNQNILLNTLALQEAKDSSAIENIITTHDELYKSDANANIFTTKAAKEVYNYAAALKQGFMLVKETGLLTNNHILQMQATLEENSAGFRKVAGTALKSDRTGEVIYTPPQEPAQIISLMGNLETFINDDDASPLDPLIKMAIIHHQFESIHPFYDGNGRTGRMINILYLVKQGLLSSPVLYLSRYINQHKADYYRLLQTVRDTGAWEEWVLYMLLGVEQTAIQTTRLVRAIKDVMQHHKHKIRSELPKIYSQDLLNVIFSHPYTKIQWIEQELMVKRLTATKYLDALHGIGLMGKVRLGRENYYINNDLVKCLANVHDL